MDRIKILIAVWLGMVSPVILAQDNRQNTGGETHIPDIVKRAMNKDYPQAQKVKWLDEGNVLEAEFMLSQSECTAHYDRSGHRKEFEMDIPIGQMPEPARMYLQANYSGSDIRQTSRVTDANNVMTYEVEITVDRQPMKLTFDTNGRLIGQENSFAE
jgi:hypothetical protein